MIYVLLLEKNKWYIGYTERKDGERFDEHFSGQGSVWTQLYKPIQVMEWRDGTMEDENRVTLEYMNKYGWWNVRGGKWCSVKMTHPPDALVSELSLPLPSRVPNRVPSRTPNKCTNSCYRCGRAGHWANDCYAKTDVSGHHLEDSYYEYDSNSENSDYDD